MDPSQFGKFIFLPKGGWEFYKIPIPQELGAVWAMFWMIINEQYGDARYTPKEYLSTATSWLPDQVNITEPLKMGLSMIPVLFKPTLEVGLNKKTFPKVSDLESKSMQNLPSEERFYKTSSDFAMWLGQTGLAKNMEMSPIKIDHLLTGHFGRAVGYATGKDTALNPLTSIEQGRYFTSGRMIQSYYDEKQYVIEQISSKIEKSPEEMIELKAKKKYLDSISEKLKDYVALEKTEASEEELIKVRAEIWDGVNTYFEKWVEVTKVDKLKYEKQQETEQWSDKKVKLLDRMIQEYSSRTDITRGTQIQNKIKEELWGNKMDDTMKRRYTDLVKEFRIVREYKDDTDVMALSKATSNEEKLFHFEAMKEKLWAEAYLRKRNELRKNDIISDSLWKELRKQDK